MPKKPTALIAYVPVIHKGYMNLFKRFEGQFINLIILGDSITQEYRHFQKDIRAMNPYVTADLIDHLGIFSHVLVLEKNDEGYQLILSKYSKVFMPNEDISRELKTEFEKIGLEVELIDFFLRWDSDNAKAHLDVDCDTIDYDEFLEKKVAQVIAEGHKTSDIYREVGGMIFNRHTKEYFIGHNSAFPDEHLPYYEGDPRSLFKKGIHVELSTVLHAEARLISEAARTGFCTNGLEILVTDFPCPPCAKLIANSGIKKVYFLKGYAMLDGERTLKDAGVEIFKLKAPQS